MVPSGRGADDGNPIEKDKRGRRESELNNDNSSARRIPLRVLPKEILSLLDRHFLRQL